MLFDLADVSELEGPIFRNHVSTEYFHESSLFIVDLFVRPRFTSNDPNFVFPQNLLLKEEESFGTFEGSFLEQFQPTNEPVGHHPHPKPKEVERIIDQIGFALNTTKSLEDGVASWIIETNLLRTDGTVYNTFRVEQRYTLQDGILRVSKGGTLLLDFQLRDLICRGTVEDEGGVGGVVAGSLDNIDEIIVGGVGFSVAMSGIAGDGNRSIEGLVPILPPTSQADEVQTQQVSRRRKRSNSPPAACQQPPK